MSELKLKQIEDKLEQLEHNQMLIIDLLYSIRTAVLDKETMEKEIDTVYWMNRFSEVYPSMQKFKQLSQKTYIFHNDLMSKLADTSAKYRREFDGIQDDWGISNIKDTNDQDNTPDGPEMIDRNSY